MNRPDNKDIASQLEEVAHLLEEQGANRFRAKAYLDAANELYRLEKPVSEIYEEDGMKGLDALPGVGESIARTIIDGLLHGRLAILERLRGESDPIDLLGSVPGIGPVLARKLHEEMDIGTLEDLEAASADGRLAAVPGIGAKRMRWIRESLAYRLGRSRSQLRRVRQEPPVADLLDVDLEYRKRARARRLRRIAPRRFNPAGEAWLPVLHTDRNGRHYTALFSNTRLAHDLNKTYDWVVLFYDDGRAEGQYTVVTAQTGRLRGRRVVRGREFECDRYYAEREQQQELELALAS